MYHHNTITRAGLRFNVALESDDSYGEPWKEEDGWGIVSDWETRAKAPGERVIASDRGSYRFYDFAGTMQRARAESWGLTDTDRAKLAAKLGRAPTRGEVTAEAVERDYSRARGWLNDCWSYVGVIVTLLDVAGSETDRSESLWGIASDGDDYIDEIARDLADNIAHSVGDAPTVTTTIPSRTTTFHVRT